MNNYQQSSHNQSPTNDHEQQISDILSAIDHKIHTFHSLNNDNLLKISTIINNQQSTSQQDNYIQQLEQQVSQLKYTLQQQSEHANQLKQSCQSISNTTSNEFSVSMQKKSTAIRNRLTDISNRMGEIRDQQDLQNIQELIGNMCIYVGKYVDKIEENSLARQTRDTTRLSSNMSEMSGVGGDPHDSYYLSHDPIESQIEEYLQAVIGILPQTGQNNRQTVQGLRGAVDSICKQTVGLKQKQIEMEDEAHQNQLYIQKQQNTINKSKVQIATLTQEKNLLQTQINDILKNFVHNQNQ